MVAFPPEREQHVLPIYAQKLSAADWDDLKVAVRSLHLNYQVMPVRAVPGSPGIILAIGEPPNFLCEYAFVTTTKSSGLKRALECVLTGAQDSRIVDELKMLKRIFGEEVKELV